jgi:hypothetical protein
VCVCIYIYIYISYIIYIDGCIRCDGLLAITVGGGQNDGCNCIMEETVGIIYYI